MPTPLILSHPFLCRMPAWMAGAIATEAYRNEIFMAEWVRRAIAHALDNEVNLSRPIDDDQVEAA